MQRFLRTLFIICFALPIIGVILLWYFLLGTHQEYTPGDFNRSENAIWMAHTWVQDTHSPGEIYAVGEGLNQHDIHHVYLHTGPFEQDGTIPESRYGEAKTFLEEMHENFPNITWYAWLGQLRSQVDLDDEQVRGGMIATARNLIETTGFDGIHYNIEPLRPNDEGFINLLRETRISLPETPISIATDEWQPQGPTDLIARWFNVEIISYWATEDFKEAMPLVDQVVIMGYDTSISSDDWYRWFLEQQVIYLTKIAQDSGTDVLLGIPAYVSESPAETLENGLRGAIQGLTNPRSKPENFAGVAIYSHWEMSPEEWETYSDLWER